jgi:CubicO group peptidase (beta-lactamase class C family)
MIADDDPPARSTHRNSMHERWYSDAGFFLLGMVIEKASGQKHREFLSHRIFEPLHMESSSVTDRAPVIKGRVARTRCATASTSTGARCGAASRWLGSFTT